MILVDTGIYIGRRDKNEEERKKAEAIFSSIKKKLYGKAITTCDILDEVISHSHKKIKNSSPEAKRAEMRLIDEEIEDSIHTEFYYISDAIRNNAKILLKRYPGTGTLTDFTSALLMKELGVAYIASFDSDFDAIFSLPEFRDSGFKGRIQG